MKKKLPAYWSCQIGGWSIYILLATSFYLSLPGFTIWNTLFPMLSTGTIGLCVTHLMRLFIIKARLLQQNILKQIIYLFLITIFFSFADALIIAWISGVLQWGQELINLYTREYKISGLLSLTYSNAIFLSIWNFIYFSYHYVKKSQKEQIVRIRFENELKIKQLETDKAAVKFQRNLADISLTALRSQMNPHFIFNCLNSIKLYTTQNDTVAASEYLTKFSRLIRLVLENSRNDRITLASELNALELYIEMEAMRFKEKLKYNISIEKDVDMDYIEIPPLLLQPYVENAIWHGLMQKEEGGRIDITVALQNNKSILGINIIDDGIGRAKAEELKSKTATKHKSYGMKVTSERLALINQIYKSGADVTIHDLTDNNGQPSGTQVSIKIPLE